MFWALAISMTAIVGAALFYSAAGRGVNAGRAAAVDATEAHFRLLLSEIERDTAAGRLRAAEATAARAELARELVMHRTGTTQTSATGSFGRPLALLAAGLTALVAFASYAYLGRPDLPRAPLSERAATGMTLEEAVARIETQLNRTPDDLRGWAAIGPAYMQAGRFVDAERAFRRIIELGGASADAQTDLAEALMMQQGGALEGEPLTLLASALARDPHHIRSRFYLAGEATRSGDYEVAVERWHGLIALADGDESWLPTARQGLDAAIAGLNGDTQLPGSADIAAMVDGLAARLESEGGSIEEWTRLVRSRLVLGETDAAQNAYDAARAAYPEAAERTELDVLAADNGLVANDP